MVTTFNTASANTSKSGNGTGIIVFVGLIIAGVLVYKYVIKPMIDKDKEEQAHASK